MVEDCSNEYRVPWRFIDKNKKRKVLTILFSNKTYTKKFKNVYVLAQGNKISIAYQIIRGICEQQSESTPKITVLFVGGGITDFALKN